MTGRSPLREFGGFALPGNDIPSYIETLTPTCRSWSFDIELLPPIATFGTASMTSLLSLFFLRT